MAYRKNVTDKQQADVERAADHSASRFFWFDGKAEQKGVTKAVGAYDLQAQGNAGGTSTGLRVQFSGNGLTLGAYNDNPARFEDPGRGGPPSPTPPVPPSVGKLYRVDFSQFGTPGEQMFDGVGHQADAVPLAPGPCNNNWDEATALADADFGSDG